MKVRTGILGGQGLGDTVADVTHLIGLDQVAQSYEELTGKSCGCTQRQESLNSIQLPSISMLLNN
jgi:hypothetical protein